MDHRADLYAFGVTAYELLTGAPPFISDSPARLLAAQMSAIPTPITDVRADVPAPLADVLMACLAKDPADRPSSAADVVRVLDSVVSSGASTAASQILRRGRLPVRMALALWGAATATILFLTWVASITVGLPSWALAALAVVMLLGLPAIAVATYVQIRASAYVNWRRMWLTGAAVVGAFFLALGAFTVARANGIGSVGSLIGKGAMARHDRLIITDFKGPAADTTLGVTITEALRADLSQSRSVRVVSRANVRDVLRAARHQADAVVDLALAREVATREGIKAILDGEVLQLGSGYVLAARLLSTQSGDELGAFREKAASSDELLPAVERLSRKLRETVGESYKELRDAEPLERVTTSSLEALKLYVQGLRLLDEQNDLAAATPKLEEAIRIDSGFAMAYRKLAVALFSLDRRNAKAWQYLTKAYELRDRLTESERLLTTADYFERGPQQDFAKARLALVALIERDSTNDAALNSLGVLDNRLGRFADAEQSYRRTVRVRPKFGGGWTNIAIAMWHQGNVAAVDSLAGVVERARLDNPETAVRVRAYRFQTVLTDNDSADAYYRAAFDRYANKPGSRRYWAGGLQVTADAGGRLKEARKWRAVMDSANRLLGVSTDGLFSALYDASSVAVLENDAPRARALARRGLGENPLTAIAEQVRNYAGYAHALAEVGLLDEARAMLRGLEQRFATLEGYYDETALPWVRGALAIAAGKPAESIPMLRSAISSYPNVGVSLYGVDLARAYLATKQPDSAAVVLERWLASPLESRAGLEGVRYHAWALQTLGELSEAKGDKRRALDRYQALLTLWHQADPELQPIVRDIRGRVERLRQGRPKG